MEITFLGHACLLIKTKECNLIVDPFISGNPLAKEVSVNSIKADYILLTHAHQDHILDAEAIAKNNNSTIVSNFEIVNYFQNKGINGHPMNHGGSWKFPFGTITYTTAIHTSSFPDGSYGGQPGGFVINTDHKTIYIAGDTALTYDMKLIPLRHQLDLAVLPIGDNFTMGIEDAIIASDFLNCSKILGYHYDTFGYIEIDHTKAISQFKEHQKELILLEISNSLTI